MKTKTIEVGSRVRVEVRGYGVKEATVISIHPSDDGDEIYQVGWRNTPWSEGGTAVSRDEMLEILPKEG
jgi:hypothetical protein